MPSPLIQPLPITACASASACGVGNESLLQALISGETRLNPVNLFPVDFPAFVGEIDNRLLPHLNPELAAFGTRNARIALAALNHEPDQLRAAVDRARARYGAHRIGIILGTSTSGIYETENAYSNLAIAENTSPQYDFAHQHAWVATARFLQAELALSGPCYAISTACSSGSKSMASAQRLIHAGVCDAVLAGGVDSLCRTTLHGFNSLELVSKTPCTPLDRNRSGTSLGEGAGLLLLERPRSEHNQCIHLLGTGESSDAHHMTAPHPEGKGAVLAMTRALEQARLSPRDIDYVNLHATGTLKNDAAEMHAMEVMFDTEPPCSGNKGLIGHTLGAAGGIEAIITWLSLSRQILPGTCGLKEPDLGFGSRILEETEREASVGIAMSNNFGFGGNNTTLILGRPNG